MWASSIRAEQTFSFQTVAMIREWPWSSFTMAKQNLHILLPYSSRIFFMISFYSWKSVQYFTTNELEILAGNDAPEFISQWWIIRVELQRKALETCEFQWKMFRNPLILRRGGNWTSTRLHFQTLLLHALSMMLRAGSLRITQHIWASTCWRALYLLEFKVLPDLISEEHSKIQLVILFLKENKCCMGWTLLCKAGGWRDPSVYWH